MIDDTHRTQILEAIPADKRSKKKQRTITGIIMVILGTMMAFVSFALMLRLVWTGATIDKWAVIFTAIPFVGGFVMSIGGAHVWSGEYVHAFLKDFGSTLKVWKKNGN